MREMPAGLILTLSSLFCSHTCSKRWHVQKPKPLHVSAGTAQVLKRPLKKYFLQKGEYVF